VARYRGPRDPVGMLATVIAILVMTVGADATIAAALRSPGAANWLNHGQDLTGAAAYLRNLNAGESEFENMLICAGILVTCFVASLVGAVVVLAAAREEPPPGSGGRGDGGPPRGEAPPALSPPQGGRAPEVPERQPALAADHAARESQDQVNPERVRASRVGPVAFPGELAR
jgi:hypothetical protein